MPRLAYKRQVVFVKKKKKSFPQLVQSCQAQYLATFEDRNQQPGKASGGPRLPAGPAETRVFCVVPSGSLIFLTQEFSRGFPLQTKPLLFCLLRCFQGSYGTVVVTRLRPGPGRHLCPGRAALAAYLQANRISFFLELFNARAAEGSETWNFASHGLSCRTFKEKFVQCSLRRDPGMGAERAFSIHLT